MKYQKANSRNIFLAALSLLLPLISYGQWWNPLAPKDYNECFIKNMKEGMGEDAVRALQYACIQKYPAPKESQSSINEKNKREERYKKCRIDKDDYKTHMHLAIGARESYKTSQVLEGVKNFQYDGQFNTVSFQNMNSFGISGIMVGFTKSKQCHAEIKDYAYSTYCTSYRGTESGVASKSFGSLSCGNLPREAKSMGFCTIGYSPFYNKFNDSLVDFLETNGYCN
jgi:hypothetical protein